MNRKLAVALAIIALLLPGMIIIYETPSASAASSYGRVSVSGSNILINGAVTSERFFGVVETTALQFAIMAYINGEMQYAGRTSHLNGPDTSGLNTIPYHSTPREFWQQYFAITAYYDCNLVRIGAGDKWGTSLQYEAWLYHHDEYISLLKIMCEEAEKYGVWLCFVLAGSQEYPAYTYKGSGSVFDTSSSAYANYIAYAKDTMRALDGQNAIFMYDMFNEPDHDACYNAYWSKNGGKTAFNAWAKKIAADTAGVSSHPRTMGVAGLGRMFSWNQNDFNLATGTCGFEILHVHYYASNTDRENFEQPERWADAIGKPLYWGELANNAGYPNIRYTFAEQAIANAGGQLITSMVLTGTPNYPYTGGKLPYPVTSSNPAELKFTSSPATSVQAGSEYTYGVTTSITTTISLTTDAKFLSVSGSTISGTPTQAGTYYVKVVATSSDGRSIVQEYTLTVTAAPASDLKPVEGNDTPAQGGNGSDDEVDDAPANVDNGDRNDTADNSTAPIDTPRDEAGPSAPHTRSVTSWRSSWLKSLFGWLNLPFFGDSSSLAKPVAMHSVSSYTASSANALDGAPEESALAMISLAATAALAGAYFWVSRKMN